MSESDKVNGDLANDKAQNSPPCSQRKPRLNRRGFHLSNHPLAKLFSEKSDQKNSNINGCNGGSENKEKVDTSQKRIISLSTVKNSTSEKNAVKGKEATNTITLKKSSCSTNLNKRENAVATEISSSCDPPPKKKHKPITWP